MFCIERTILLTRSLLTESKLCANINTYNITMLMGIIKGEMLTQGKGSAPKFAARSIMQGEKATVLYPFGQIRLTLRFALPAARVHCEKGWYKGIRASSWMWRTDRRKSDLVYGETITVGRGPLRGLCLSPGYARDSHSWKAGTALVCALYCRRRGNASHRHFAAWDPRM